MTEHSEQYRYFAGDVEGSVGSPPGSPKVFPPVSSMVSTGLALIGSPDQTFYAELRELTEPQTGWDPGAEKIHGLSRARLRANGTDPRVVMEACRAWVLEIAEDAFPVYCAMPISYDFEYMDWYFRHFGVANPFRGAIDGRSFYRKLRGLPPDAKVSREQIWREFPTELPHSHNALDDAIEYADVFGQMLREASLR